MKFLYYISVITLNVFITISCSNKVIYSEEDNAVTRKSYSAVMYFNNDDIKTGKTQP